MRPVQRRFVVTHWDDWLDAMVVNLVIHAGSPQEAKSKAKERGWGLAGEPLSPYHIMEQADESV